MKYNLVQARPDFDKADRIVRSTLRARGDTRQLRLITSDSSQLVQENRDYVDTNPHCMGVCFGWDDEFDVWVSPAYRDPTTDSYLDTVIHELCHGYLGVYEHNHRWKRFLGRTLHHYSELVRPLDLDTLIPNLLARYTRQSIKESSEAFQFRLEMEQISISKAAVDELPDVARLFNALEAKS